MCRKTQIGHDRCKPSRCAAPDEAENEVKENTYKQGDQEGHNLVPGYTAGKKTNANIGSTHEQQSKVTHPHCGMVDLPDACDTDIIGQGKCQGEAYQ